MSDREVGYCQIGLAVLFFSGYFAIVGLFMLGYARVPVDYKEMFSGLLALLTAGGLMILQFFFSRSRAPSSQSGG